MIYFFFGAFFAAFFAWLCAIEERMSVFRDSSLIVARARPKMLIMLGHKANGGGDFG